MIYLVGAGPGDPGLITVKGLECLRKAEIVVYDALVNPRLLEETPECCEKIFVGKKGASHSLAQEEINCLLIDKAKQGKRVVRLKGGDPFIFGRGGEEAIACSEAGVPFQVIPGITAGTAVAAYAGIPVTHRDLSSTFTLVTGHEDPSKGESQVDWKALPQAGGTLVIYMGLKSLAQIAEALVEGGLDPETPAATIQWGTLPAQQVVTAAISEIADKAAEAGLESPAITVVGEVVKLREPLNWFELRPLFGKRILITRPRAQAADFVKTLEDLGAEAVPLPLIKTEPVEDMGPLDDAIREMSSYDWAIFTSVNGVEGTFARMKELGADARSFHGVRICAIGPATAGAIESRCLNVDCVPDEFVAEGVIEKLLEVEKDFSGKRFLLARAEVARSLIPDEIRSRGGEVNVVGVYRTVPDAESGAELLDAAAKGEFDMATFTSSSTVRNFCELAGDRLEAIRTKLAVASIGPVTSQTAREFNLNVDVEATEHTIPGLVKAILKYHSA